jgi:cbb3-type cytochrome oxidase subunit 3
MLIGFTLKTIFILVLYAYMWAANKKRDNHAAEAGSALADEYEREAIERGMLDVTELDNKGFRYVL